MKKFKKFVRSKWHGIPLGAIAIALVASMAVTGSAYAAVTLLSGSASITVNEAITIETDASTDGTVSGATWNDMSWVVSTYPGETKTLTLKITNAGAVGIPLYATISETDTSQFTETTEVSSDGVNWTGYVTSYTVGSTGYIKFSVTASTSCDTGTYSFAIGINR